MNVRKLTQTTVIDFMRFVSTKLVVIFANAKMDSMVRDWIVQVKLVFLTIRLSTWYQVRGDVISTHQPYRADEKWESVFVCQSEQFVALKFDIMEFSKIANDILRIQLLTAGESEFQHQSVFSLVLNKYINILRF